MTLTALLALAEAHQWQATYDQAIVLMCDPDVPLADRAYAGTLAAWSAVQLAPLQPVLGLPLAKAALRLATTSQTPEVIGRATVVEAIIELHAGNHEEAGAGFRRFLEQYSAEYPAGVARSHQGLGFICDASGDQAGAMEHYRQGLVAAEGQSDRDSRRTAMLIGMNLAGQLASIDQVDEARAVLARAVKHQDVAPDWFTALLLLTEARIAHAAGSLTEAAELARSSLEEARRVKDLRIERDALQTLAALGHAAD